MKLIARILLLTVLFSIASCQDDDKSNRSKDKKEKSRDRNDSRSERKKSVDPEEEVKAVFDSYIRALSRNDWERAAGYCDRDARRAHEEMAAALYGLDSYYRDEFAAKMEEIFTLKIISIEIKGDEAKIITDNGQGDREDHIIIKNGKEWLIKFDRRDLRDLESAIEDIRVTASMIREMEGARGYEYDDHEPGYDYDEYGSSGEDVFYCNNGKEIPGSWVYDGDCDCDDCEDE